MSGILRGTTPSLKLRLKTEDCLVTDIVELEVVVWNGTFQNTYGLDDVTLDSDANKIVIHFTEEETMRMDSSKSLRWQMRAEMPDGNIVGTRQSDPIDVEPLKSREVMSG